MENPTDFDFYLKFTKPLVLNLPKTQDKVLAATWVKKLMDQSSGDEKTRLEYLKLLLFVLQRKIMIAPFLQHPNSIETLPPFPENKTLIDVAKEIIEKEHELRAQKRQKESGDYPPFVSDFSADLLEYAAIQNIDNFGVHGYYAVSKLPLNTWLKVDKQFLPKAAKSMVEVTPGPLPITGTSSQPSLLIEKTPEKRLEPEAQAAAQPPSEPSPEPTSEPSPEPTEEAAVEEAPQEAPQEEAAAVGEQEAPEKVTPEESPPLISTPKKKETHKKSTLGASPPSRPIGKISPPAEDRSPPTWGSNLLEVKDVIDETKADDLPSTPEILAKAELVWPGFGKRRDIFEDISGVDLLGDISPPAYGSPEHPSFLSSGFLETEALDSSMLDSTMPLPFGPLSPVAASSPGSFQQAWTSAASLPYATPPYPPSFYPPEDVQDYVEPPPRVIKKKAPKIKQTRASMLLQKKKEEAVAPPAVTVSETKVPKPPVSKKAPKIKPTRASLMLQKKKEEASKPPEEPPKKVVKKPRPAPQRPSKTKIVTKEEAPGPSGEVAPAEEEVKKAPKKPGTKLPKKKGLQKLRSKKPSGDLSETASEIIQEISIGGEKFKGFDDIGDVDAHLEEYNKMLREMEEKYQQDVEKFKTKWSRTETSKEEPSRIEPLEEEPSEVEPSEAEPSEAGPSQEAPSPPKPRKRGRIARLQLSKLAKRSMAPLPKTHGDALPLEKSIHISPEARETLEEFSEAPTEEREPSPLKHPVPRLPKELFEEESEETTEGETTDELPSEIEEEKVVHVPGKDRRISSFYEKMMATMQMSPIAEVEHEDWELDEDAQLEDLDVNVADISRRMEDVDQALLELQAQQGAVSTLEVKSAPSAPSPERGDVTVLQVGLADDFESVERAIEEEMKRKGEDPRARKQKRQKISKEEYARGKQRYLDVHARAEAQLEQLMEPEPSEMDFEELEKMVEQEMRLKGEDPHAREKKLKMSKKSLARGRKKFLEAHAKADAQLEEIEPIFPYSQDLEGLEEQNWVSGPEFFANLKMPSSPPKDPRAKPDEAVFPTIDFGGEQLDESFFTDDALDELLAESPPSTPERQFRMRREVEDMYHELLQMSPGLAGVPVTVPRPSTSPRRIDYSLVTFSPPKSPPDPYGLPGIQRYPTADRFVEQLQKMARKRQEAQRQPSPPPPRQRVPSPPPTPRDYEDDIFMTVPPEEMGEIEEEEFYYLSPIRLDHKIKERPKDIDTSGISPPNKFWYREMKERQRQFYGSPEKVPDVFDLPAERLAGETPPKLASPHRESLSPPIDPQKLREEIYRGPRGRYTTPYKRRVGPKHVVHRYSHGPIGVPPLIEDPLKEALTQDDLALQDYLSKMKKKKRRREVFKLTTKKFGKKAFIQRRSPAPRLATVPEAIEPSPPRQVPNVFDLPDMFDRMTAESPPGSFFETRPTSPPVSPEDPEGWKAGIREQPTARYKTPYKRRVGGKYIVKRKSPAPKLGHVSEALEDLDQAEWERRGEIYHRPVPRKHFPKISEPILLPTVSEHIEYDDSPLSSRDIPPSPRGTMGPRRRELRKRLAKRRIDFSAPSSPDEAVVEAEQIETDILPPERNIADLYEEQDLELPPEVYEALRPSPKRYFESVEEIKAQVQAQKTPPRTPPKRSSVEESPRTPPVSVLDLEEQPGLMDELIYVTPPTPRSEWQAIQKMKEEVRQHELQPRQKPRRKIRDQIRQRRGRLSDVEEMPLEERATLIHEQIEAEVEAQLAAEEAAQRERERNVLDEPVPGDLPSPMRPVQQVPFYETPPHLRKVPKKEEKKIDVWPAKYRDVLTYEEMPELAPYESPSPPSPPLATAAPYFPQGVRYSPRRPLATETEGFRSPTLAEEEMPADMAPAVSPVKTHRDIESLAELQYKMLSTTPEQDRKKPRPRSPQPGPSTRPHDIEELADLQYKTLLSIPEQAKPGPSTRPDDIEFQYEEKIVEPPKKKKKEKTTKGKSKAKGKGKAKAEPEVNIEYDMDALKKLGVSETDMRDMDLYDLPRPPSSPPRPHPLPLPIRPRSPESPPPEHMEQMYKTLARTDSHIPRYPMRIKGKELPVRYKYLRQTLPKVPESADEYKPPSPMGWNMRWDLSPQSRVNLRAPEVKVEVSPLKTSRFEFERVQLESPPRPEYHRLLPLPMPREQTRLWPFGLEYGLEMEEPDLGLAYTEEPELLPPDEPDQAERFERLERLEEVEGPEVDLEGELEPEELDFEPPRTPSPPPPPPYKSPEPVSPSKLKGELQMHEYYDPKRKLMRRTVKVKGKNVRMRSRRPGLETIHESTPPKSFEEEMGMNMTEFIAYADRQYAALMSREQQRTPSPETVRRKVAEHEFDPELYNKEFDHMRSKRPPLSPPIEAMELLSDGSPPRRLPALGVFVPHDAQELGKMSPPIDYIATDRSLLGEVIEEEEEEDIWAQQAPGESPIQLYASPAQSPEDLQQIPSGPVAFDDEGDWGPQIMQESPSYLIEEEIEMEEMAPTPSPRRGDASVYRGLIRSPQALKRLEPIHRYTSPEGHGLPGVTSFQVLPETPKKRVEEGEKKSARRRLVFESPKKSPEAPQVQVLEVEAQVESPKKPPSPKPPSPMLLAQEEMPSFIEETETVEVITTPPRPSRSHLPFGGRTSPGILDTSPIPPEQDIPPHLRGFKWMD